jgi:homoserine kinase type II
VINDDVLRRLLAEHWGLADAAVTVHNGGMNSATWWVDFGSERAVAKHTPGWNRDGLIRGMRVATIVQDAGIPSGAPIPACDQRLVVDTEAGPIALLRFVPGVEPPDNESGLSIIGETLGRVHLILRASLPESARTLYRPDPDADCIEVAPDWVRPGIQRALADYHALDPRTLTHGLLHTDPAPEAFLVDPVTGTTGLIDWTDAVWGPLLYDVASAVMYVGGPERAEPMLDAYLGTGAVAADELRRGLDVLRRYRWAIQAWYFAGRIADNDMTGIDDPAENLKGLMAARPHLAG